MIPTDPLPISALQHLVFCERQCALIHIEGLWAENRFTVEGRHLHEKAHDAAGNAREESRPGVRIVRSLPLRSERLNIWGYADAVEFRRDESGDRELAFPVEYKRGRPKAHDADRVQLCAQVLCLEEMLNIHVSEGAIFYGKTRRRYDVQFDADIRQTTEHAVDRLHELIASCQTPVARREKKCETCSLLNLCLPDAAGKRRTVSSYLRRCIGEALEGGMPDDDPVEWKAESEM